MKTSKKDKHFIKKPSYPGGPKALWTFIRKNLRYPKEALENKVSGVVRLKYTINDKGTVVSTQIIHSLGYGCDEEASRVISMLKYHVPIQKKIKRKFHKSINIKFRLPTKKKLKVTYSQKKPEVKEKDDKKGGYEYTITLK